MSHKRHTKHEYRSIIDIWGKTTSINTNGNYFGINQTILSKDAKAEKVMVGDVLLPVVDKTVMKESLSVCYVVADAKARCNCWTKPDSVTEASRQAGGLLVVIRTT